MTRVATKELERLVAALDRDCPDGGSEESPCETCRAYEEAAYNGDEYLREVLDGRRKLAAAEEALVREGHHATGQCYADSSLGRGGCLGCKALAELRKEATK